MPHEAYQRTTLACELLQDSTGILLGVACEWGTVEHAFVVLASCLTALHVRGGEFRMLACASACCLQAAHAAWHAFD